MIRYFVLLAGFALLASTPAAGHTGAVEVIRGAEIQQGVAQAQDAAGVAAGIQVLRGVVFTPQAPDRAEAGRRHRRARAPHRPRVRVKAGEDLWLVEGERVTACRLHKTLMVGGWEVRCYDADLPAGTY